MFLFLFFIFSVPLVKATCRCVAGSIAECRQWIGYNSWNTYFRRSRGAALSFPFLNVCEHSSFPLFN